MLSLAYDNVIKMRTKTINFIIMFLNRIGCRYFTWRKVKVLLLQVSFKWDKGSASSWVWRRVCVC